MCGASLNAENTRDGVTGDICEVGFTFLWQLPALLTPLEPGKLTEDCVVCIQSGSRLKIQDVAPKIREEYGIRRNTLAIFLHEEDKEALQFDNGSIVDLNEIALYGAKVEILVAASGDYELIRFEGFDDMLQNVA